MVWWSALIVEVWRPWFVSHIGIVFLAFPRFSPAWAGREPGGRSGPVFPRLGRTRAGCWSGPYGWIELPSDWSVRIEQLGQIRTSQTIEWADRPEILSLYYYVV
jgi:hypothetical protein